MNIVDRTNAPLEVLARLVSKGTWLITPIIDDVITCPCLRVRSCYGLCVACGRPGWCER